MATFMIIATVFLAITKLNEAEYCYADDNETYSYHGSTNGPKEWPTLFPGCHGTMQSPIDIQTGNVRIDLLSGKLTYEGYDAPVKQATVVNNGHTVKITPQDNVKRGITVYEKSYDFQQLHFHWGSEKHPGAEHTLDGRKFEMEAHFVHKSSDNRIAVVGVLVQVAENDNGAFKPIVEVLSSVQYKDGTTQLKSSLDLNKLLPDSPASYYSYDGSLTTPTCAEGVAWFVLKDIQTIGRNQLASFSEIYSVEEQDQSPECLLAPNNRPVQKLCGRKISSYENLLPMDVNIL